MSREVGEATDLLRNFMFEEVYVESAAKLEEKKVQDVIDLLFSYYMKHPDEIPAADRRRMEEDGRIVCIMDYIAGMTDKFAVMKFQELFVPHSWTML